MLISAGGLGPANMAKSKNEKGGRQRERKKGRDRGKHTVQLQTGQHSKKKKKKENTLSETM